MNETELNELALALIDAVSIIGSRKGIQRDDDVETLKRIAIELINGSGFLELPIAGRKAELIQQFLLLPVNERENIIRGLMKQLNPRYPNDCEFGSNA